MTESQRYASQAKKIATHRRAQLKWTHRPDKHFLDLRDPHYGHRGGWMNRSEVVLLAPFRVLCEFMEREEHDPKSVHIDWSATKEHRHVKREIDRLYVWWTTERPAFVKETERLLSRISGQFEYKMAELPPAEQKSTRAKDAKIIRENMRREAALKKKDEQMIVRLIRVAGCLWT